MESQRSPILSLLQKGKDLQREPNAPDFLKQDVQSLEAMWNENYNAALSRLKRFKETSKVWDSYKVQKRVIMKLLEDAEQELQKIVPKYNHKKIQNELRSRKDMREDIKRATGELMGKMREISDTLASVASKEQQDEFAREMADLEARLNELLSQCDEKIRHLEDLNVKWTNFSKNLAEMKGFIESAKKNLGQITSLEMSPEDRLRMTRELQHQVRERMKTLESLERDAQFLFAESPELPEVDELRHEVATVKMSVTQLNENVDDQSAKISEDLEHWTRYKNCIAAIKPWLEQAEIKMAVGLMRPLTISEARNIYDDVKKFHQESADMEEKILEIGQMSGLIKCKTSASNEVDALQSRWQAAQATAGQWMTKMETLVGAWNHFNLIMEEMRTWIEAKEEIILGKGDRRNPEDSDSLAKELGAVKEILQEISKRQADLIMLTREGEKVGSNLSQEVSSKIRATTVDLKQRISGLVEAAQVKIEHLSELISQKQEFQSQLDSFNNWIADVTQKIEEINEIPVDRIDKAKEKAHVLSQDIADKKFLLDKLKNESIKKPTETEEEEFSIQLSAAGRQYESLLRLVEDKKSALSQWLAFLRWHSESLSHLEHIQVALTSHQTATNQMETLALELENIAVQCQTRKIEGGDEEAASARCNTFILDGENGKPVSILFLVADILQKIVRLKKLADERKGQQENLEAKWEDFRQAEKKLADWLQVILSKVQKISVRGSTLSALEEASQEVSALLTENEQNANLKTNYRDLGRFLMQKDPAQMKAVQEAVSEAESKWTKVTNLLSEQQSKSQTLIAMWKQCIESRNGVNTRLEECDDILESLNEVIPQSTGEAASHVDRCKESVSVLKKTRQPFEAYYKRQTQLISELHTVPGFDTSPLKRELSQVQQKFGFLGEGLTKKMNNLDSQLVIWRQVDQMSDDILCRLRDAQAGMKEALLNLSDSDIARVKLEKFKTDLESYMSAKAGIEGKIEQLKKLNNEKEISSLAKLSQTIEFELKTALDVSAKLEKALGNLGESSQMIRDEVKATIEELNKIREDLLKCEDTSGSDECIYERLKTSQLLQSELAEYEEKINSIEQKIKNVQAEYGAGESSVLKDLALLEKKYDTVNAQCTKVISMLYAVLEKHYVDKVKQLTKFNNNFKEKISWCLPEPSSEKYSTECKLNSLKEIENTVKSMKPVLNELEICGKVIMKIVDDTKNKEIQSTLNLLSEQIHFIENEILKINILLEKNIKMWQDYEISSEILSSWLKETEDLIRSATGSQIDLENFDSEKQKLLKLTNDIADNSSKFAELAVIAKQIKVECPDSKVDLSVQSLNARYSSVSRMLSLHLERLNRIFLNMDSQRGITQVYNQWLINSKARLKEFEDFSKSKNLSCATVEVKMKELKILMSDKETGNQLLEKAIDAGEQIFSEISPSDRETIRTGIRALRDGWESHIDYMNAVNKKVEAVMLQWSSLEDKLIQIEKWLELAQEKSKLNVFKGNDLSNNKALLHQFKSLQHDIESHKPILQSLQDSMSSTGDATLQKRLTRVETLYKDISENNSVNLSGLSKIVYDQEKLNLSIEKAKDLLDNVKIEFDLLNTIPSDVDGTEQRIANIKIILEKEQVWKSTFSECQNNFNTMMPCTTSDGYNFELDKLTCLEKSWDDVIFKVRKLKEDQENISDKVGSFQKAIELLSVWLTEMELRLKDLPMRKDIESKTAQYNALVELQQLAKDKDREFNDLSEKSRKLNLHSELNNAVSKLAHRFENLKVNLKDTINKYDSLVKEHKHYSDQYRSFFGWISAVREDLQQFNEIVGDLKILQDRRNNIEDLEEMRINETAKFDIIIEMGEKLYPHTSVDGKEVIREQLQILRKNWDALTEEIQNNSIKIDTCIQQFSDFTSSQEQLTKWLKDIEKHMQQHTELKPSLQEKKAQLQNHKIVHQEVTSHNSLVETVCQKAQQLVDQTKDKSLNVYIDSIRVLFKNIGVKSGDLMEKLQVCVDDHEKYQLLMANFTDFISNQSDILTQCGDISGEKADLERKQEILSDLRSSKLEGSEKLQVLEDTCSKVSKSTSKKGCDKIRRELNEVKESWSTHLQIVEDVEFNLEKGIALWNQFSSDLEKHQNWFKAKENVFRNQTLHNSLEEKKKQLEEYHEERLNIINYEKTIDDFVNNSHNLFHNSRVERLKPLITQISNRYQLLHVLSKDVEAKWQGIVEDHEQYAVKLTEITKWLSDLDCFLARVATESNVTKKLEDLHAISAEQDSGSSKVLLFSSLGERLFPDTGGNGREVIRQDTRNVRDQWDIMIQKVKDMQKRQDVQLQHWSAYQDGIVQMHTWLDSIEKSSSLDQVNWLSVQETRSRLLKLKSIVQDISSHKRLVEAVNEKAAAVISSSQTCNAEEIQDAINSINERFNNISGKMDETILMMEEAVEYILHYQSLQKTHHDWQKQMWDKLSVYTDYTGSKNTLEARLEKVGDMEKDVNDGKNALANIDKHIQKLDSDKVFSKVKELLVRDSEHLR